MKKIINFRPIVFICVAFFCGVTLGGLLFSNIIMLLSICGTVAIVGAMFWLFKRKGFILILTLFTLLGMFSIFADLKINSPCKYNAETVTAYGRICDVGKNSFIMENIKIDGVKRKGKITVVYYNAEEMFETGHYLDLNGEITSNDIDLFDFYSSSLFCKKVYYTLKKPKDIAILDKKPTFSEEIKAEFLKRAKKYCDVQDLGIMYGLIFGDKSMIDYGDSSAITGVGMSHILAVSGLHVGFLFWLVIFILKKIRAKPAITMATIIAVWITYSILTGFPAGVKRAGIMSIIYLAGNYLRRKNDILTTLSLSGLLIVMTNPRELFSLSFILSIGAVLGIICYADFFAGIIGKKIKNKLIKKIINAVCVTVSANVFILPVLFNVFNQLAVYTVIANLLILPLVSVGYVLVLITAILSGIIKPLAVFYKITALPITLIRIMANYIFSLPYSVINVKAMSFLTAPYLAAVTYGTPYFMTDKRLKKIIIFILMTITVVGYLFINIF